MKELILDYLKEYGFDLQEILKSNKKSGKEYFQKPNDTFRDKHLVIFKIESDEDEIDIYINSSPILTDLSIFHEFSEGLIELINSKSDNKIQGPNSFGSFGWNAADFSLSFGVNDEVFQFEFRISVKK